MKKRIILNIVVFILGNCGKSASMLHFIISDMDKHDALCLPENRAACIAFCFWHSLFHIPYGKGNVGTIFSP